MLKFVFIRHGKTKGNLEKRYIGRTNEPILESSKQELLNKQYPKADKVYLSPMLRCTQTASIIYPNMEMSIVIDFTECNFGEFENKNYIELSDNKKYQEWIDSNGKLPFPSGEDNALFRSRSYHAFQNIANQYKNQDITIAIVAHGGTIMSIFDKFSYPNKEFYSWQVENGCGFTANYKDEKLTDIEKF